MAERKRRIIFNDDGDAQFPRWNPGIGKAPNAFLDARFNHCVKTQVDSYFWCVDDPGIRPAGWETPPGLGDLNQVLLDACRKEGLEAFLTVRLNDTHDACDGITHPLKKAHPEYLLNTKREYPGDSIMRMHWSGFDYAFEEVREHHLGVIREFCDKYDFDGLELDFSRHPLFFRPGEEDRHVETMTGFVSRVKGLLDDIASRRGRPWLLGALVPETPALARKIGLDVETWLEKGLVDLLSTGWGYRPYSQKVEEMIALGHRYGVPVYPNINCSAIIDKTGCVIERLRGMAANFFAKGGDGVYMFNMFAPVQHEIATAKEVYGTLNEIGDPETLKRKDKLFGVITAVKWPHAAYSCTRSRLPVSIVEGAAVGVFVGDDVAAEDKAGNVKEVRMIARVSGIEENEEIAVFVNGRSGRESARRTTDEPFVAQYPWYWEEDKGGVIVEWDIEPQSVGKGENAIAFKPGPNSPGRVSSKVQETWLWVRYV